MSLIGLTVLSFTLMLFSSGVSSDTSVPIATAQGDYQGRAADWMLWQVVDSDPGGLNCRASRPFVTGEWVRAAYEGQLSDAIGSFPVVRRFVRGTVLFINPVPSGLSLWYDERNRPWLRIKLSNENDSLCFVRANNRYVVPVISSLD